MGRQYAELLKIHDKIQREALCIVFFRFIFLTGILFLSYFRVRKVCYDLWPTMGYRGRRLSLMGF